MVFFGSSDHHINEVDTETDEEKWKFKTVGAIYSAPLVVERLLVFTSRDKFIYALDPENGNEVWKVETGEILTLEWEFDYYIS